MMGKLEVGSIQTVCRIKQCVDGSFEGQLSIPGWGTKFTGGYPDKTDAVAALADLRREAFGPHVSEAALPAIEGA